MLDFLRETFDSIVIFNQTNEYIDLIIIFLVVLALPFREKYWPNTKVAKPYKLLIISFIFVLIYLLTLQLAGALLRVDFAKYFLSYAIATSFNELFFNFIMEKINAFFSKNKEIKEEPKEDPKP